MPDTKVCPKCNVEKLYTDYHKHKATKDGLYPSCKVCRSDASKKHYKANPEKEKARVNKYRQENKDKVAASKKSYRENNKEFIAKQDKAYRDSNKARICESKKDYYDRTFELNRSKRQQYHRDNAERLNLKSRNYYYENKEVLLSKQSEYYQNTKEVRLARTAKYKRDNPDKVRFWSSKRRVAKLRASPAWLTTDMQSRIAAFYTHAKECEMLTGDSYHVDHIVPLQGENVCGLHVPWNLQVLPSDINMRKSNNFEGGWT